MERDRRERTKAQGTGQIKPTKHFPYVDGLHGIPHGEAGYDGLRHTVYRHFDIFGPNRYMVLLAYSKHNGLTTRPACQGKFHGIPTREKPLVRIFLMI